MAEAASDTRDEVMQAPDLHELFCERTAAEFHPRIDAGGGGFGAVLFATLAALFALAGKMAWAKGCLAIFLLQTGVLVWTLVVRSPSKAKQLQEDARRGVFPAESAGVVLARLRWWSHLISPRKWARQSRVHDRRFKLERRMETARERIALLHTERTASRSQVGEDAPGGAAASASRIRTLADREMHLKRLGQVEDELTRATQELALYEVLRDRIAEVTDRLERLEKLTATIYDAGSDLSRTVAEALSALEERRQVVRELDLIDPDDFLRMITF